MRTLIGLLAAVSLAHGGIAAAAPFPVTLGDGRIVLDSPPGFSDTGFLASPRLQELAESLTSASNRVLLFALTDADLRRFMGGDAIEAKRYMVAVTPRGMERERLSSTAFSAFVTESLRELGTAPAAGSDYRKFMDGQPGKPRLLLELRRDGDAVSVLQGMRVPSGPKPFFGEEKPAQYILSTTTLLLIRGKALNLAVFGGYESPADLDWIRFITTRWIDELQRLNTR